MVSAGVTDIGRCVDVMEETLILMARGDYRMAGASANSHGAQVNFPAVPEYEGMPSDGPDRRCMAMPAYLGGRFRNSGVKWYGSNTENRKNGLPRSIHVFVLNDADTGAPLSIMSANLLSAYRTGAVPGVVVKHLAVKNASTVGIIGPGVMSRTILGAALSQRPGLNEVKVKGRSQGSTQNAVDWIKESYPQIDTVRVVDTEQEAIEGSDIVIAGTSTSSEGPSGFPYFKTEWIKPGALLLMPAVARLDDDFIASDALHNIGDIADGKVPGRINNEQIFCFSIGGMPVEDVAWATEIYETAKDKGIGTELNLWDTPALA